MATVPQKELRNSVGEVLRGAEAGEEITITVAGRPVAQLGPAAWRRWVRGPELRAVRTAAPRRAAGEPSQMPAPLEDPLAEVRAPWGLSG